MMRIKYVGPDMGATGPQDGGVYNVVETNQETGSLRVIDESKSDWNYDDDPNWKPGYMYSATAPSLGGAPGQVYSGGNFYIVEDDENGSLAKAGVLSLPE